MEERPCLLFDREKGNIKFSEIISFLRSPSFLAFKSYNINCYSPLVRYASGFTQGKRDNDPKIGIRLWANS